MLHFRRTISTTSKVPAIGWTGLTARRPSLVFDTVRPGGHLRKPNRRVQHARTKRAIRADGVRHEVGTSFAGPRVDFPRVSPGGGTSEPASSSGGALSGFASSLIEMALPGFGALSTETVASTLGMASGAGGAPAVADNFDCDGSVFFRPRFAWSSGVSCATTVESSGHRQHLCARTSHTRRAFARPPAQPRREDGPNPMRYTQQGPTGRDVVHETDLVNMPALSRHRD